MKELLIKTSTTEYPIVLGHGILDKLHVFLNKVGIVGKKVLIISDQNVAKFYLEAFIQELKDYEVYYYVVEAGEQSKSMDVVERILEYAIVKGLDRTSTVIALGGGVIGDLAGFVASIYMRGITFVQCPTTILAHDSSVGGKVAINHRLGKNLIGSFYQPKLVFYDTANLSTLPIREIRAGLAEVIKHGLIADEEFTYWLMKNADLLQELNTEKINNALLKGITIKGEIVKEDEWEHGNRALLNYGHTLAHGIEIISNYLFLHGEAVAIGMAFASKLSDNIGLTDGDLFRFTASILEKFHLPISIPQKFDTGELMNIILRDKKFKSNNIRMILPTKIGEVKLVENIEKDLLIEVIDSLKK